MSGREILICVNQGVVLERQAAAVEDAGWCCLREMTSQPKETVLPMVQVGASCCRNQQEAASSTTAGSAGGDKSQMDRRDQMGLGGHWEDVSFALDRWSHGRVLS